MYSTNLFLLTYFYALCYLKKKKYLKRYIRYITCIKISKLKNVFQLSNLGLNLSSKYLLQIDDGILIENRFYRNVIFFRIDRYICIHSITKSRVSFISRIGSIGFQLTSIVAPISSIKTFSWQLDARMDAAGTDCALCKMANTVASVQPVGQAGIVAYDWKWNVMTLLIMIRVSKIYWKSKGTKGMYIITSNNFSVFNY